MQAMFYIFQPYVSVSLLVFDLMLDNEIRVVCVRDKSHVVLSALSPLHNCTTLHHVAPAHFFSPSCCPW